MRLPHPVVCIRSWFFAGVSLVALEACLGGQPAMSAAPPQVWVDHYRQANAAYEEGRYEEALSLYQALLEQGGEAPEVYYNLGNACFRLGQVGWSLYYFEKARRLEPRDGDVLANQALVSELVRDRLPNEEARKGEASWLLVFLSRLQNAYTLADVVGILTFLYWAAAILASAAILRPGRRRATVRLLRSLGVLVVVALLATGAKIYQDSTAPDAIVVVEEVQVRSGPAESSTVQFALHEGTALRSGREAGAWVEVIVSEELRGWVQEGDLAFF